MLSIDDFFYYTIRSSRYHPQIRLVHLDAEAFPGLAKAEEAEGSTE